MPDRTAFGRWPSNAQGRFGCSHTYVIQRLAPRRIQCRSQCLIFFSIAAVAYPSNFSICDASCTFQMIWWHLLLTMLCAHAAFASTGDVIAALAPLHRSQVKVTIKIGAQIFCSLLPHRPKTRAVGVAPRCRASFSSHRFLPRAKFKDKPPKKRNAAFFGNHLFTDLWQHVHNIKGTRPSTWVWRLQETACR